MGRRIAKGVLATALVLAVAIASASPGLAAQNGVIVFQRGANDEAHFVSISPTGQGLRSIGPGPGSGIAPGNYGAAFSPDGQTILFAATTRVDSRSPGKGIYAIGVDGGGLSAVISSPEASPSNPDALSFYTPSYFPSGREIVFSATEGSSSESRIYAMGLDGSDRRQLTSGHKDSAPVVSPDGAEIAFDRTRDYRHSAIFVMGSDGSALRRISDRSSGLGGFSPDGRRIVFARTSGRNGVALFTMAPDGSRLRRLTRPRPGVRDVNPVFSPDGRSIAFLRISRQGQRRLFTASADGSHLRLIAGDASAPIWQPLPD